MQCLSISTRPKERKTKSQPTNASFLSEHWDAKLSGSRSRGFRIQQGWRRGPPTVSNPSVQSSCLRVKSAGMEAGEMVEQGERHHGGLRWLVRGHFLRMDVDDRLASQRELQSRLPRDSVHAVVRLQQARSSDRAAREDVRQSQLGTRELHAGGLWTVRRSCGTR